MEAKKLMLDPTSVRFHNLLITMTAGEQSVMKSWPAHLAGSGYLPVTWSFVTKHDEP